eukprot:TRINITY_DN44614_c0_g1_i2.p1 TRINITY_DN44614_c0_g1~~TRINITY_DN44614_c0_g1_i2.p1  ORF type:complete len:204 (+),score=35.23 TRINITY_DN44614_c0_g1_i2:178-789(+)
MSEMAAAVATLETRTPEVRLQKPHAFFPFDVFDLRGAEGYLSQFLQDELSYVISHSMVPPYPWGQVIYHDFIVEHVSGGKVPGDFAELGIGKGGTSVFFARLAKKFRRKFWAVDSFEGLPPPDIGKDNAYFLEGDYRPPDGVDNYEAFMAYKTAFDVDDVMHVTKAFFNEAEIPPQFEQFAFVHLFHWPHWLPLLFCLQTPHL